MSYLNQGALSKLLKKKKLEEYEDSLTLEIENILQKAIDDKIRIIKNKNRVIANDNAKEHFAATDIFDDNQISRFPSWVREDIDNAQVIGKSNKVIQVSNGKKYHASNTLNDLSGGEWTFFLNSVINTRYTTNGEEGFAHHIRKIHPSPKPPQLMKEIIEFFTKEGDLVFDYFMGVGGSLLAASQSNRRAIGIDLCDTYINAYKEASNFLNLKHQKTIQADSVEFLQNTCNLSDEIGDEKLSLILIDPPYGDMLSRPKTGEALKKNKDASATPFTDLDQDLGNMQWDKFLITFNQSVKNALIHLKTKGHLVVFIKDLQPKDGQLNLLHADVIRDLNSIDGLNYVGTKIWADHTVNLYPYGYPHAYVSNQIHQYIMIFKKI
ncbi:hypothetical protein GCM10009128_26300 [Psychrosphaera haliotis]|uniref:DNA methyltransferase n=1 Tax=Psychrosphaera haliotis TaxID=555083 RepID=UPI0031D95E50